MPEHKVYLIGIDGENISSEGLLVLESCGTVVGTERLCNLAELAGKKVISIVPLDDAIAHINEGLGSHDVAVLASGDPLFFGIGRRLLHRLGEQQVIILPAKSSMQVAAARFKVPWDNAEFVSFHGRGNQNYAKLLRHRKVFALTDKQNSPDTIAGKLLEVLEKTAHVDKSPWKVFVGERLGLPDERIVQGSLREIADTRFDPLNIMLLMYTGEQSSFCFPRFGLQEHEIIHSRGLITKNEVRAATLHALRLPKEGFFWDVGAGSGSVSVEAATLCPQLHIFAIERDKEQLAHIRANSLKHLAVNVTVIDGEAPSDLAVLPDPDRIFIGGSGGKLKEIIQHCSARLALNGRLVINGVTDATKKEAPRLMHEAGLAVSVSEIAVSRYTPYESTETITLNPISIMVGQK